MSLDEATVARMGRLARISIAAADLPAMVSELNCIVAFVEQLNEVDTEGVEPMVSVVKRTLPMREDRVSESDIRFDVIANAPEADVVFYTVPKVIE